MATVRFEGRRLLAERGPGSILIDVGKKTVFGKQNHKKFKRSKTSFMAILRPGVGCKMILGSYQYVGVKRVSKQNVFLSTPPPPTPREGDRNTFQSMRGGEVMSAGGGWSGRQDTNLVGAKVGGV